MFLLIHVNDKVDCTPRVKVAGALAAFREGGGTSSSRVDCAKLCQQRHSVSALLRERAGSVSARRRLTCFGECLAILHYKQHGSSLTRDSTLHSANDPSIVFAEQKVGTCSSFIVMNIININIIINILSASYLRFLV